MKRFFVAAIVSITTFVLAPIASAHAETGVCHFEGTASFKGGFNGRELPYEFMAEEKLPANTNLCVGTGGPLYAVKKATVSGSGTLSCTLGASETGKGSLVLENVLTKKVEPEEGFEFTFTSVGPVVDFTADGPKLKATGVATFAADASGVLECVKDPSSIKHLEFHAVAEGEL